MKIFDTFRWKPGKAPHEKRQSAPYSDAIVAQILSNAGKVAQSAEATAAVEASAGIIGRAFAMAEVNGASVSPSTLTLIARDLLVRGESVMFRIGDELLPVASYELFGTRPASRTWLYDVELNTPGGNVARYTGRGRSEILHVMYSVDPARHWVGIGPVQRAVVTGQLTARIEQVLSSEANSPVGYLLPIPLDASDATVTTLRSDLENLNGRTALVETTASGWGEGRSAAPRNDYQPQRIGANPPPSVIQMHTAVQSAIFGVCGIPTELVLSNVEGTGQREAWRRCLHGTIQPLGNLVAAALSETMGRPVTLGFDAIFASDIMGRARAFQSLVGGGMEAGKAAGLSGLLIEDEG